MSLLMGENESKLVELFHLREGEACRILLPLSRNNASISSIYPMDDVSWYQFGQYKTLIHTENLLEIYKADLKLRGNHINHNNSNFDDRIIYNMKLAFAEARYALENGEVPVGCVFINSSNIIKCFQIFPNGEVRKNLSALWHQADTGTRNFK